MFLIMLHIIDGDTSLSIQVSITLLDENAVTADHTDFVQDFQGMNSWKER